MYYKFDPHKIIISFDINKKISVRYTDLDISYPCKKQRYQQLFNTIVSPYEIIDHAFDVLEIF